MPLETFPNVPIGEFTITRPFTAPGLFAYRHMQAKGLLSFPNLGSGDLDETQRKEALERMVNIQRPLAAIVLFLGVVGLEDFIRDLGARLATIPGLEAHFGEITKLGPSVNKPTSPYSRSDKDPAPLSDWNEVNKLYLKIIGITPIQTDDLPKLHDLALIRHTVAHHAALVRQIDLPRFQHWDMQAGAVINPPARFVSETLELLYRTGRRFECAIADRLFAKVLKDQPENWHKSPSDLVLALIEAFNWFGNLLTDDSYPVLPGSLNFEEDLRARNAANRSKLTQQCITELQNKYEIK